MEKHNLDAILITGSAQHNPPMTYLTGIAHITSADLIKKRGCDPVLFYNSMERDEAAKTGLVTKNLSDYQLIELLKQTGGDFLKALVLRYKQMLTEFGVNSGRVALYGKVDIGAAYAQFKELQDLLPEITFVGELDNSMLLEAMATKDDEEVEHIRRIGNITVGVVSKVAEYLTSMPVEKDTLIKPDGKPLTIGDVKRKINLWIAEAGAENPEDTIFAIGRDAGVPHSSGTATDHICLGKTIVFDIFPCEAGGGYFYDFTRTWCLGYAPDEVQALYEDVLSVFNDVKSKFKLGTHCPEYQKLTCDLFEARGYPTIQSNPQTEEGYVHSLGHGVGLNIHERPWFGKNASPDEKIVPGSIFTCEPGLYYPNRNMGVRIEDTFWARSDGQISPVVDYPVDLVLPVKRKK
ncbi:MAG: aminopeptidase P family protein [Anaerolineales bacterium]|nr:aminopeptidase P family protein [Anaerolineales bacterium]